MAANPAIWFFSKMAYNMHYDASGELGARRCCRRGGKSTATVSNHEATCRLSSKERQGRVEHYGPIAASARGCAPRTYLACTRRVSPELSLCRPPS